MQHGEPGRDGRPHRGQHRHRAEPDALGQGVPDAPLREHPHHPGARHRGRLQHPVRALAAPRRRRGAAGRRPRPDAVLRDRGEPAREPLVRAGVQGDGLSHRAGRGEDRGRAAAGRDPERGDAAHEGGVRARAGLLRHQVAAMAVRQVRAGRPRHRHADEGDGRGDGDRPGIRGGAAEGGALDRARGPHAAVGVAGMGRASRRGAAARTHGRTPVGDGSPRSAGV